jgi:hypothetical protein
MKFTFITVSALSLLSTLLITAPFSRVLAQDPPATTYKSGFWQPVADFNPTEKVTIRLINQTEVPLEYGIAGNEENISSKVDAGQTGTIETSDNSANIAIYPSNSIDPDTYFTLKFNVKVDPKSNTINVNVIKADRGFVGHRSINLQKTGKIYLY